MVKIRLRRTGAKKQPSYRVVVADSHSPRDGKFIEVIGFYDPRTDPPTMEIDAERAIYWLGTGAQPSEAVRRMLDKMGITAQIPAIRRGEKPIEELVTQLGPVKEKKAPKKKAEPLPAVLEEELGEEPELGEEADLGDEEETWDEAEVGEAEDEEEVGLIEDEEYDDEWDEESEDIAEDDE